MIRNWYNQIPYPALKTKREITKYINWRQFTKGTRGKPNEQLFPKQVVIQLPKTVCIALCIVFYFVQASTVTTFMLWFGYYVSDIFCKF